MISPSCRCAPPKVFSVSIVPDVCRSARKILALLQEYGELLALSWAVNVMERDVQARVAVFVSWGSTDRPALRCSLDDLLAGSQLWRLISAVRPEGILIALPECLKCCYSLMILPLPKSLCYVPM